MITRRFLVCLGEAVEVRYGFWEKLGDVLGVTMGVTWEFMKETGQILKGTLRVFGRPRKASYAFSWWTYYKAVTQSLRLARIAKWEWSRCNLDVDVCLAFYDRYERIQKRALERGYVKLASGGIHDDKGWTRERFPDV